MKKTKNNRFKLATAGLLTVSAFAGSLFPSLVNAALVTGVAKISIDNPALAATTISGFYPVGTYISAFFDSSHDLEDLTNVLPAVPTVALSTTSTDQYLPFPVQPSTVPSAQNDRFPQATTMDTSNTSVGQIGLSGAMRNSSTDPTKINYLENQDLSLQKVNNVWNVVAHDSVGGTQTLYQLASGYSELIDSNGNLNLSGNLIWGDGTNAVVYGIPGGTPGGFAPWVNFAQVPANLRNTVIGHLELSTVVPVPAAVWLFGSALLGFTGLNRYKAKILA